MGLVACIDQLDVIDDCAGTELRLEVPESVVPAAGGGGDEVDRVILTRFQLDGLRRTSIPRDGDADIDMIQLLIAHREGHHRR